MSTKRAYYSKSIAEFMADESLSILGALANQNTFDLDLGQRNAWLREIEILKDSLLGIDSGHILLEYTIPRMGKRVDAVLIFASAVVIIEFKVGASVFDQSAISQAMDYALDLKYFHAASETIPVVPIVVATLANSKPSGFDFFFEDNVHHVQRVAPSDLRGVLRFWREAELGSSIDANAWIHSAYRPTPTIIEAAQVLFSGHGVEDISRNDASAFNLERTASAVNRVIDESKSNHQKSICLVTGVPGAGKTLAGLAVANSRQQFEEEEHAVFLSGNGPLVDVLREALARDESARLAQPKSKSLTKAKAFIQNIHHFRDDALQTTEAPHEKVTVFDEAQRAWDAKQLSKFMIAKRGILGFDQSEPEFLIEVMDRHRDWAVVVCLVGEGQDINTGEAGIAPWLEALESRFSEWLVYASPRLTTSTYGRGSDLDGVLQRLGPNRVHFDESLHLSVSIRSFRSETLSSFVEHLLENDVVRATDELKNLELRYPIVMTRSLDSAREWVRSRARGTERYGLTATSGAKRLRTHGIWVDAKADPPVWFLNGPQDVRSSYGLEFAATEFDIQGLELDWSIVAWDGDLRHNGKRFDHWEFRGAAWNRVNGEERKRYLTNAYRVLLTRARQGMVIFIPEGDGFDGTRSPEFYDRTFAYLKKVGIPII